MVIVITIIIITIFIIIIVIIIISTIYNTQTRTGLTNTLLQVKRTALTSI